MLFVASQHFIDIKNKVEKERRDYTLRQQLRDEIILYSELKAAPKLKLKVKKKVKVN